MNNELIEKTDRLCRMMAREGWGGVLLNAQHNFSWLTGGGSNAVDTSHDRGVGFLLVRADGKRYSIANNIETPRLFAEEISAEDFEPVEFPWVKDKTDRGLIAGTARSLLTGGELVSDLPVAGDIRAVEHLIAACRYSLTVEEQERYRALSRDAGKALGGLAGELAPGASEIEIAAMVRSKLAACRIDPVVLLVGSDERIGNFRHPVPTEKRWDKTLLIVICGRRGGLIANLSRIYCAGDIPAGLEQRTAAAAFVFGSLLAGTREGAKGSELYRIAAEAYRARGFADEIELHHQGGACGYRTRDWVANPASEDTVRPGQAFAWSPSITGTKVEETAILTDRGIEIVTASPGWPQISAVIGGQEYFSPGVMSL